MVPERVNRPRIAARPEHEPQETPPWVVAVSALLVSIPLGLCCYLLLKL